MENERGAAKWHIASVSWGKDSLAMLLLLIEKSWPLDEVVFYDTGMEFQAIYDTQDRMLPELERLGIKYTRLEPENPFLFDMLERPVQSRQKGAHRGYGWCGGLCRWGTTATAGRLLPVLWASPAGDRTRALLQQCELPKPICERMRVCHGY